MHRRYLEKVDLTWPGKNNFAVWLTHDVDRVQKTYQYFTHFLKTRNLEHLKGLIRKKNEPYWNFKNILKIERKYKVKSTFFFLNESKKIELLDYSTWKLCLGRYNFSDKKISTVIRNLDNVGWEVGLHGSYDSYNNKDILRKEKDQLEAILGKPIEGIRQHYLNLDVPVTWKLQEELGFKYDASFGLTEEVGFREGICRPFYPFDNDFLEIPLTIMDSPLMDNYQCKKERLKIINDLLDVAEANNSIITILWHQRVFNEKEFPGYSETYEDIIVECKKRKAWFATGSEIYRHLSG